MPMGDGALYERIESTRNGGKNVAYKFGDTRDFKDYLALGGSYHTSQTSRQEPDDWNGGEDFEKNLERCTEGWDEHRSQVNQNAGQITADAYRETESLRPHAVVDFFGGAVDMGRYVTGDPENMIDFKLAPSNGQDKVCTLLVGVTANCGQNASDMVKRGAAIVALIDILAGTGRAVEVWVEATTWKDLEYKGGKRIGQGNSCSVLVCVKPANGPMDLDQLLYMVAHPGAFRKSMFAAWEGMDQDGPHMSDVLSWGYGFPSNDLVHGDTVDATVELENMGQRTEVAEVKNPVGWIVEVLDAVCG